jgi:PadR family transcriptional regulator, regulatory protein PadR
MGRRRKAGAGGDLIAGTLDMLILRTLQAGPAHGLFIAEAIGRRSEDVLLVEQGSLYPALHRLEERGWISPYWGTSENNRRARFYRLTARGRRELLAEASRWELLVAAVGRVMRPSDL